MAGLFDLSPEVLAFLQNGGGGLLTQQRPQSQSLLGDGWDDPRSGAIMGLGIGLLRGDLGQGFANAQSAFNDGQDRQYKRQAQTLAMGKEALGLQQLYDNTSRQLKIRDELQRMELEAQGAQGSAPGRMPAPYADSGAMPGGAGGGAMPGGQGGLPSRGGNYLQQSSQTNYGQPQQDLGQNVSARMIAQAGVYARNGDIEGANKLLEHATKMLPEVNKIEVMIDPESGKPVNVITYRSGRQEVSRFGATPKVHWADTGSSIQPIDENTMGNLGPGIQKTATPGEVMSNKVALGNLGVAQGNLSVSRERLALDANSPTYQMTDGGLVALPKRPQPGAPLIGQPVTGPDGQPLSKALQNIPAGVNTAIVTNMQNLTKAKQALALLQGGKVGTATGDADATGWKGFLPNTALNRIDPAGVDTRAAISDLGSMILHDRSGAAVTAAESPRLMPFIPRATDDAATAAKKLERFVSIYQQETDALAQTYSREQGYKENPILKRNSSDNSNPAAPLPLPPRPKASDLRRGQSYQLPNGVTAEWDGFQFKSKGK